MVGSISSGGMNASMLKQMQDKRFQTADVNGDGKITKDELNQVAQAKGTQKGPSTDKIFESFDTNNDSSIDKLEFDAGSAKLAQQMQGQEAQGGKGPLPSGGGGGMPGGGAGKSPSSSSNSASSSSIGVYDEKDTNKDGVVSPQEELEYALKHLDQTKNDAAKADRSANNGAKKYGSGLKSVDSDVNAAQGQVNISV
jgi:hypothetical protein